MHWGYAEHDHFEPALRHYSNGLVQEEKENYSAAEKEYRLAIVHDPNLDGAYCRLIRLLVNQQRENEIKDLIRNGFGSETKVPISIRRLLLELSDKNKGGSHSCNRH